MSYCSVDIPLLSTLGWHIQSLDRTHYHGGQRVENPLHCCFTYLITPSQGFCGTDFLYPGSPQRNAFYSRGMSATECAVGQVDLHCKSRDEFDSVCRTDRYTHITGYILLSVIKPLGHIPPWCNLTWLKLQQGSICFRHALHTALSMNTTHTFLLQISPQDPTLAVIPATKWPANGGSFLFNTAAKLGLCTGLFQNNDVSLECDFFFPFGFYRDSSTTLS